MGLIRDETIVDSIARALQYSACYHPPSFLRHLTAAYEREGGAAAKAAIGQILESSRMAALGRRAVCQDTGTVNVWLRIGMSVRFEGTRTPQDLVDAAVRRAWSDDHNPLRASMVRDPLGTRRNTGDNTPAMVTVDLVPGDTIEVALMAKGGGAENKSRLAVLRPSDSVEDWLLQILPTLGAGWCPPGILGIGVGGSADVAMRLAKQSLYDDPDMLDIRARGPATEEERWRLRLCDRVNALGIGAQGLGGLTTVLDVKLRTAPTHASALPVALIPQCAATRVVRFRLSEDQPFALEPPGPGDYPASHPAIVRQAAGERRVDLDALTAAEKASWRVGDLLLLSGHILTARDAAHARLVGLLDQGQPLPVDLRGRTVYYAGPVRPNAHEVVGPAGPTTATRMDKFTPRLLAETGLGVMIGKAERGAAVIAAIREHQTPYLIAVGGAAVLVSQAIRASRVVAFADLGMEAIHEFRVADMPVIVAVDTDGRSIHDLGPAAWRRPAIAAAPKEPPERA